MARNVLVSVVVHGHRLVPELAAVKTGHDGACVHDVRHAALAQGLQVARCAQRACFGSTRCRSAGLLVIPLAHERAHAGQPS